MDNSPFSLEDYKKSIERLYHQSLYGCGNLGCCINPPKIGTNAGCRCYPHHIVKTLRRLASLVEQSANENRQEWRK